VDTDDTNGKTCDDILDVNTLKEMAFSISKIKLCILF
jgi:hypothetical protein